jgi:hypothetical protein
MRRVWLRAADRPRDDPDMRGAGWRRSPPLAVKEGPMSQEAQQRKARSEARLEREAVPINRHLPMIESEAEVEPRTREEIALRALCLLLVAVKGEGLEQDIVERIVDDYGLAAHFTPKESAFVADPGPSEHDRIQFCWRYEAAWVLLWALGYVEALSKPTHICDVGHAVEQMKERSTGTFIADARLRPLAEILDEADLIYRYHWAVVDARIKQQPAPAELMPGVTMERHYALNWLVRYMDQAWDDISTDT